MLLLTLWHRSIQLPIQGSTMFASTGNTDAGGGWLGRRRCVGFPPSYRMSCTISLGALQFLLQYGLGSHHPIYIVFLCYIFHDSRVAQIGRLTGYTFRMTIQEDSVVEIKESCKLGTVTKAFQKDDRIKRIP